MKLLYQVVKSRPVLPEGYEEVILMPVEGAEENVEFMTPEAPVGPITLHLTLAAAAPLAPPAPNKRTPEQELKGEVIAQPAPKLVLVEFTVLEADPA